MGKESWQVQDVYEKELNSIVKSASKKAVAKVKKEFTANKTTVSHKKDTDNSDNALVESIINIETQFFDA